ncbi:MAG: reprolysin-like metallopeptidase [Ginsengibacter sp.]
MGKTLLTALCFLLIINGFSQDQFWKYENEQSAQKLKTQRLTLPQKYETLSLSFDQYTRFLANAPKEFSTSLKNGLEISIPYPDKKFRKFRIVETKIMEDGIASQYPGIKTFVGKGTDDPTASIYIDQTYQGFHAYIRSPKDIIFIDPYQKANKSLYISYYSKDYRNPQKESYSCDVLDPLGRSNEAFRLNAVMTGSCIGTQLRTYRVAVACTGEYAQAVCPVGNVTVANTLSAIVTTMNRVDGVYESELDIRMILVNNEASIIFTNPATDPFNGNNNASTLINESETVIEANIGNAFFDIGHTFSTGGGGLAGLGVVCVNGSKASGITGSTSPTGDAYDIDYVAHEIGHEFGANHTFESKTANCGGGNRNSSTAYEVGSGTSVMAYAGICGTDDIQPHSDPYFYSKSFDEITAYVTSGSGSICGVVTATGNNPPVITMPASDLKIPLSTPFTLTGVASDPEDDPLSYSWEEWDISGKNQGTVWDVGSTSHTSTTYPLFKQRIPKTTGSRTFPDINVILAGYPANPAATMDGLKGETLTQVARDINFRLVVRDNNPDGGGVATAGDGCSVATPFKVVVTSDGPFTVSSPNTNVSWLAGSPQTVTWNVANTNSVAGINCQAVDILMSTDGGFTYPYMLASNTPNDGTQSIITPVVSTTSTVRIMVRASANIFFDISDVNFTVSLSALPVSILNFSAAPRNNDIALKWSTSIEALNKGFEVLRSDNASSFTKIGFVAGAVISNEPKSYAFTDTRAEKNIKYYYRLRQVDMDNNGKYSDIRTARINGEKIITLSLQPVPFYKKTELQVNGIAPKNFVLMITDMMGKVIQRKNIQNADNFAVVPLDLSEAPAGTYVIKVMQEGILKTIRAVKL